MNTYHHLIILTSLVTAYTIAMEDYQLDLAHIKTLQRHYIGKHGWTMDTGNQNIEKIKVARTFKQYRCPQFLLQHNKTNKSIISKACDIHIIDMQTGDVEKTLSGYTQHVSCCTHTDYRNILVTGSTDKTIKLWNIQNGQCLQTLHGHNQMVINVATKGNTLFSTDREPCLKLWDIASSQCKRETPFITIPLTDDHNESHAPRSIMIHNNLLYIGAETGKITSIDPRFAKALCDWNAHKHDVTCLTPCKNNNLFYSGSGDHTIKQWDIRNMSTPIKTLHHNNPNTTYNYIRNVYEDHSSTKIFSSDVDTVYIWDIARDKPTIITTKKIVSNRMIIDNCMHMNNDETELYVGTQDGIITLTPTLSFEELAALAEQK